MSLSASIVNNASIQRMQFNRSRPNTIETVTFSIVLMFAACVGCTDARIVKEVVIYTSTDKQHSSSIFQLFTQRTGIQIKSVHDFEAAKTVGLANRLIAERTSPEADVFWNSEVSRSIALKRQDVLFQYSSPEGSDFPQQSRDAESYWTGFGARARVILCNTNLVKTFPTSIQDFTKPEWKGCIAIANPLFGTTSTHVAAWFSEDPQEARELLLRFKTNGVVVTIGNAQARDMVASGEIAACLTDTDDAQEAIAKGRPVKMIYPDQGEGQRGVLLIPNTVALIKGGPNPENAKKFIDFLLSKEVEQMLAHSPSAHIPVRDDVPRPPHVKGISELKVQKVDYEKVADALPESSTFIRDVFLK